jgi:hypothetical protein
MINGTFSSSKALNLAINRAIFDLAKAMAREAIRWPGFSLT